LVERSINAGARDEFWRVAARVAVIKGFEGLPFDSLTHPEFSWGTDGHYDAGAPRFDIFVQPPVGPQQTVFIGCSEMTLGLTATASSGPVFQQRSHNVPSHH
jgi:hypothetical protein